MSNKVFLRLIQIIFALLGGLLIVPNVVAGFLCILISVVAMGFSAVIEKIEDN